MSTPTYVGLSSTFNNNITTGSVVNGTAVAVGDLLVALVLTDGGNNSQITPGVTDTVNAGAWNLPGSLNIYGTNNVGGGYYVQIVAGWIRCDTAGTPTINFTGLQANDQQLMVLQFTGFTTGHPTLVSADIHSSQGVGTALSLSSFTNSAANEVLIQSAAQYTGGNTYTGITGGFTNVNAFSSAVVGYAIPTTSGNSYSFSATGTSATAWIVTAFGFQDAGIINSASIAWVT